MVILIPRLKSLADERVREMRVSPERILIAVALLAASIYAYDYLSVRHRMSAQKPGDPFDVITYPHLLAIPQKGNRVEYALDAISPWESEKCVHSLFPHFGYTPCWYINRKASTPTPMVIVIDAGFGGAGAEGVRSR
jgi:hypothetical protein